MARVRKGSGLLMVYTDVVPEFEEEFNRWYNEEHIPERLSIPGVLDAARYRAVRGGPKHLAVYELTEPEAWHSDAWQHHLNNPTPWSQRLAPSVVGRNNVRNLYRLAYPQDLPEQTALAGMAPALLVGRMSVALELDAEFNRLYDEQRLPLYRSIPGYLRGRRFQAVMGEPRYLTVHECQATEVADSPEWEAVRAAQTPGWTDRIQPQTVHAHGSPGVYTRIFP